MPPNCEQLDCLREAVQQKRLELEQERHDLPSQQRPATHIFAHPRKITRVLPHPPYSPVLAPSDYHVFRFLPNSFDGKNFLNLDAIKIHLEFFAKSKTGKRESLIYPIVGLRWSNKRIHTSFNKDSYVQVYLDPHLGQKTVRTF